MGLLSVTWYCCHVCVLVFVLPHMAVIIIMVPEFEDPETL